MIHGINRKPNSLLIKFCISSLTRVFTSPFVLRTHGDINTRVNSLIQNLYQQFIWFYNNLWSGQVTLSSHLSEGGQVHLSSGQVTLSSHLSEGQVTFKISPEHCNTEHTVHTMP